MAKTGGVGESMLCSLATSPSIAWVISSSSTFRRFLWPLVRPHRKVLGIAVLMNAFSGVAISIQTLIPKYFIDDILLNPALDNAGKLRVLNRPYFFTVREPARI